MISILKVELFRLKKSTAFWLCLGLCVALPLLSLLLLTAVNAILESIGENNFLEILLGENGGVLIMTQELVGWSSGDNILLALIATAVVLAQEFSHGTIRNMIIANKKRSDIFFAFYIVSLIIGITYLLAQLAATLLFFGPVLGFGNLGAGAAVTAVLCQFAMGLTSMLCVQTMVCMFLFVTKKTSLSILLPIVVCMFAPELINGIITVILTSVSMTSEIPETVLQCIPFFNWSTLNPQAPQGLNVGMVILYNLLFGALFFWAGISNFRKSDLK